MSAKKSNAAPKADDAKFLEVKSTPIGGLQFVMGNGRKVVFDPAKCSEQIRRQAMLHGFNQKIRDAAAGYSKTRDFGGALDEMQNVIEALYNNEWNRKGGAGANREDLAAALAEVRKAPIEKARAAVDAATPEQRKTWASNPTVAAIMARIRADRLTEAAKGTGDGGDLPEL